MRKVLASVVSTLLVGLGIGIAWFSIEVVVLFDYDSGATKRQLFMGPLLVREDEDERTLFARFPTASGRPMLTGRPDWHVAFVFERGSDYSPLMEASRALVASSTLSAVMLEMPTDAASQAKTRVLRVLRARGASAASDEARTITSKVLDDLAKRQGQ